MRTKTLSWMLALTLFAGGVAACGSDDDKSSTPATAATSDAGDSGSDSGSGSSNPDVKKFCDDAKALADQLKAVMADPTKGDVAALTQQATQLSSSAAQLISANASDSDEINACTKQITDAVAGG